MEAYIESLSNEKLNTLERQAIENAEGKLIEGYSRSKESDGPAFAMYRRMILEREVARRLSTENASRVRAA